MESTVSDFEMVKSLRNARIVAIQKAQTGQVRDLLVVPADALGAQVYVVKLLDVHPKLGKVAGRRLLADIGIQPLARVADLTTEQREAILQTVGESA